MALQSNFSLNRERVIQVATHLKCQNLVGWRQGDQNIKPSLTCMKFWLDKPNQIKANSQTILGKKSLSNSRRVLAQLPRFKIVNPYPGHRVSAPRVAISSFPPVRHWSWPLFKEPWSFDSITERWSGSYFTKTPVEWGFNDLPNVGQSGWEGPASPILLLSQVYWLKQGEYSGSGSVLSQQSRPARLWF